MTHYEAAKERYAEFGVDTDAALEALKRYAISLHCWQVDDVGGFESPDAALGGGGIQATGNYPARPVRGTGDQQKGEIE
jgi:L-rhamnose isomerase